MDTQREHTPGLLKVDGLYIGTDAADSQTIAYLSDHRNTTPRGAGETLANGRRLVACWNACEGIRNPEAVPDMLAALRSIDAEISQLVDEEDRGMEAKIRRIARSAIAKATEKE